MDETLKHIEKFHGHLGPYVILGYKMGLLANHHLGSDPFCKKAEIWTGSTPPISCLIDGIQLSSGCTYGKGALKIKEKAAATAVFSDKNGRQLSITVKPVVTQEIDSTVTDENIVSYAEKLYFTPDDKLFTIR